MRVIRPAAPARAKNKLQMLKIFCAVDVFFARRPVCRSQRSAMRARSRKTTVTVPPAMNRGFRLKAPMSDMYAMFCPGDISTRCLFDEVAHTINIASSIPSQTHADMVGSSQYDIIHMVVVVVLQCSDQKGDDVSNSREDDSV